MPLDMNQAIAQYGTLGVLANAVPDLKAMLEQGAREEWTPDRFFSAIQQTGWWKSTAETRRQAVILQETDPATWNNTREQQANRVRLLAQQMGVSSSVEQYRTLAEQSLLYGWDEGTLRHVVGGLSIAKETSTGTMWGAAGEMEAQLRKSMADYGVGAPQESIDRWVQSILRGEQTLATYENYARGMAKSRYPNLAEQIDAGMSVRDVASPYISQMAQTLELADADIDLSDSSIQKALTDRDEKGAARTKPLWQFERELKDDPRWDKTKNAHNQTYDMLARIGQDWGFSA